MTVLERFLKYVKVHTASEEGKWDTVPSTRRQLDLVKMLAYEMEEMGLSDVRVSEYGYVFGSIPATPGCEDAPAIGFIAHMPTAAHFSGENVKPRCLRYEGGDIELGNGEALRVKDFPNLEKELCAKNQAF